MGRCFRTLAVAAVAVMPLLAATAASAGAGCHLGFEKANFEATGTTVNMKQNCFGPTVLRVEPGSEVTFVNRDEMAHRVDGVGWGSTSVLAIGESTRRRFEAPGTYPFACVLHPGMVGAVVVGDGRVAAAAKTAPAVAPSEARSSGLSMPAVATLGAVGLAAVVLGLSGRRRRRQVRRA